MGVREKYNRLLSLLVTAVAITSGLAIGHSDTTLAPGSVVASIPYLNWALMLSIFLLLICGVGRSKLSRSRLLFLFSIISFLCLNSFYRYSGDILVNGVCVFGILLSFVFVKQQIFIDAIKYYRYYLIFLSIYGVASFLDFSLALHVIPHTIVEYYSGESLYYANYGFSYLLFSSTNPQMRLCGLFNEPGAFGTMLSLMLTINKFNLRKKENLAYLAAGFCTLSMAFWTIIILGLILQNLSRWRTIVVAFAIAGAVFMLVQHAEFENPGVQHLIERFQWDDKKGDFKGNNRRSESFKNVEKDFELYGDPLLGGGTGYVRANGADSFSSYKSYLIDWGWLGFIFTYGVLFLSALAAARKQREAMILIACFFASIYQRPGVFSADYILLLFGGIFLIQDQQITRQRLFENEQQSA